MKNNKEWLGHSYNGCVKSGRSEQLEIMIADLLLVDGTADGFYKIKKKGKKCCRV